MCSCVQSLVFISFQSVTGTVRQRSSRATTYLRHSQPSREVVAMDEDTLIATDDTLDPDDDPTWEAISHEVVPLTIAS